MALQTHTHTIWKSKLIQLKQITVSPTEDLQVIEPILIFFVSRIIIFLIPYLLVTYGFGQPSWLQSDAPHYLDIVLHGYSYAGYYTNHTFAGYYADGNTLAFFPLYPLIVKFFSVVIPANPVRIALMLSLLFGMMGSLLLYFYAAEWKGHKVGLQAVMLFSFYPVTIFLSAPYTEGLFFLLLMASFLLLKKQRYFWASVTIGLACATRITGVILLPILFYKLYKQRDGGLRRWLFLGVAVLPLLLFMYYQYLVFGSPFANTKALYLGWEKVIAYPWVGLWHSVIKFREHLFWQFELSFLVLMVITLILARKQIEPMLLFFGWGTVLLTLSANYSTGIPRYMMVIVPFYLYWADFFVHHPTFKRTAYPLLISLALFNSILYLSGGWIN